MSDCFQLITRINPLHKMKSKILKQERTSNILMIPLLRAVPNLSNQSCSQKVLINNNHHSNNINSSNTSKDPALLRDLHKFQEASCSRTRIKENCNNMTAAVVFSSRALRNSRQKHKRLGNLKNYWQSTGMLMTGTRKLFNLLWMTSSLTNNLNISLKIFLTSNWRKQASHNSRTWTHNFKMTLTLQPKTWIIL